MEGQGKTPYITKEEKQQLWNGLLAVLYILLPLMFLFFLRDQIGAILKVDLSHIQNVIHGVGGLLIGERFGRMEKPDGGIWRFFSKSPRDMTIFAVCLAVLLFLISIPDYLQFDAWQPAWVAWIWLVVFIAIGMLIFYLVVRWFGSPELKAHLQKDKKG